MRTLVPTPTSMLAGKDYRDVVSDPTKNLLSAMATNSFTRIKTALAVPGVRYGWRDSPDRGGLTLLMRVCRLEVAPRYRRDLARLLLEREGVEANARDCRGRTALAHACLAGDRTMVRCLAEAASDDLDPNLADWEGDTPLMHACRDGNVDVVDTLLVQFQRLGLNVDQTNKQGVTPLIESARHGHADICRRLVTVGRADVSARDAGTSGTAQDHAIAGRRMSTPDLLLLSPVAQRKLQARRRREAEGRSSLADLMRRDSYYPASAWQRVQEPAAGNGGGNCISVVSESMNGQTTGNNTKQQQQQQEPTKARRTGATALQQEHLQHLNSRVFQLAKYGLDRVAEQPQEDEDLPRPGEGADPRRRKISTSLPDLSAAHQEEQREEARGHGTPAPGKTSSGSSDNHIRVSHQRPSLSMSPTNSSPIPPSGHPHQPNPHSHHHHHHHPHHPMARATLNKQQQHSSQTNPSPRLKLPLVDSPNQSPVSARRRVSVPNRAFAGSRPVAIAAPTGGGSVSRQALLSKSPPDSWAPSAHQSHQQHHGARQPMMHITVADNKKARTRMSWEGKPSSSIPSYLFR